MNNHDKAKLLHEQLMNTWGHYLKFYTMFWTVNFVAFGLTVEHADTRRAVALVAIPFILQNILTTVSALSMARYTRTVAGAFVSLECAFLDPFRSMGVWGARANAIAHVVIIGMWIATIVCFTPSTS